MHVTFTPKRRAVDELDPQDGELSELEQLLTTHVVGEKDGEAIILARFNPCPATCRNAGGANSKDCGGSHLHRLNRNVAAVTGLGVDIDDVSEETVEKITDSLTSRGIYYIAWTTHSHAPPENCRFRLVFPFADEMLLTSPRQWSAIAWPALVSALGLPAGTDFSCRDPSRVFYTPRIASEDAPHAAMVSPGTLLDWKPIVGDAVAAAAREVEAVAEAPDEDPTKPVDLVIVRDLLARIDDPLLKRVLKGEAPAAPPEKRAAGEPSRREAWKRVTVHLANVVEGWESTEALLELLRTPYRAEVAESPDDHTEWERIEELFVGARASAPAYKAEKKARERAWHELRKVRLRQTSAALDAFAQPAEQNYSAEVAMSAATEVATAPAPISPVVAALPLTDHGNVLRFMRLQRDRVRFVGAWGTWVRWEGQRWRRGSGAIDAALETAKSIYAEAQAATDPEAAKRIAAWAHNSSMRRGIEAMPRLASSVKEMQLEPDDLDRDQMLFNCQNGTLDLRTGELKAHAPRDLITRISPVSYDADAKCTRWEQFLERILPSAELREFVQRAVGYALTGDVGEQVMFFMYGFGSNGKSTFLTTLQHVLGDYARQGAADLLLSSDYEVHAANKADLQGARFVVCSEVEQGRAFAEVTIKQLTGGDQIKARFMHRDFFEFRPSHKIFLAANHRPRVRGTDNAIWRRLRLIPFEATISGSEIDPLLSEKLRAEASGILAWAVRGCLAWQARKLGETKEVKAATAEYRDDQDALAHFIDEHIEAADSFVPTNTIYSAYVRWCERTGEKPWTSRSLSNALIERGLFQARTAASRGFKGIRMKTVSMGQQVAQATAVPKPVTS